MRRCFGAETSPCILARNVRRCFGAETSPRISARNVPRCFGAEVCIDLGVDYAKFDGSRYAECYEIAQRSFFGPSEGKSDATRSFLMVPRPTFDIPSPPSVGFCSHFDSVPRIKKCELSNDFEPHGGKADAADLVVGFAGI